MAQLVRNEGGIDWLISKVKKLIGKKSAKFVIGLLVWSNRYCCCRQYCCYRHYKW